MRVKMNAGYFQLQLASERDRAAAYKIVGKNMRDGQMAYIGVTVT